MSQVTEKFKSLLGAETGNGWIKFMDEVNAEMPFLFGAGRPTKEQIQNSEIGRCGHASFAEYVEKSLNWNVSQWRAWMRAFKVVQKHSYLRQLNITASAINTLNSKSDVFPASLSDYENQRSEIVADQQNRQDNSLSDAKRINAELTAEIERLKREMAAFNKLPWYKKLFFKFPV
jgi:hypothetical protein